MNDLEVDKELPRVLSYFLLHNSITIREKSIEMLFSKGYENHWSLTELNWGKVKATNPVEIEELN